MATKLGRMVSNLWGLLLIMLLDSLATWSCESTWHIKFIISHLPQCLWPLNLAGVWRTIKESQPLSHKTLSSRGFARSSDKLKTLFFHYHNAYDHRTWKDGFLPWTNSTQNVTRSYNHLVLQYHVTN